MPKGVFFKKKL